MTTMSPQLRKLAFTAHVTSSVGWLGAVAAFLGLSIIGLTSAEAGTVRAVYLAMEATGWYVLIPLSLASLLTGLIQSLGTRWGLLRHYWVFAKQTKPLETPAGAYGYEYDLRWLRWRANNGRAWPRRRGATASQVITLTAANEWR
jgi:hypothetical protein